MKNLFWLIFIAVVLNGCNEGKGPKVIDTTEGDSYMTWEGLQPVIDPGFNFESHQWKKVTSLLKELSVQEPERFQKPGFIFRAVVYFLENGNVEKIVLIESISKKVDSAVVDFINKSLKIGPPKINGKPVKFHADFIFTNDPGGFNFFPRIDNFLLPPSPPPDENTYFIVVDEMPSPIGGIKAIQEKIVYPKAARDAGIEGKVFVKAYINESGTVVKTQIIKGIGGGCNEAAIDAIMKTKFNPGKQRGKPVKVQVTIPIMFKLN